MSDILNDQNEGLEGQQVETHNQLYTKDRFTQHEAAAAATAANCAPPAFLGPVDSDEMP